MITDSNLILFHIINNMAGKSLILDNAMIFAANYLIYIFGFYLAYIWLAKNELHQEVLFSGYSALLGLSINFFITLFYFHPRPFMVPTGTLIIAHAAESSFPSDHATVMFSISLMLLTFQEMRRSGAVFFILAFISGFARVYSGLHFPMDIAGSLLVASLSVGILLALKNYIIPVNNILIEYFKTIRSKLIKEISKIY